MTAVLELKYGWPLFFASFPGGNLQLLGFQVFKFRNIIDSGWVEAGELRAIIAQNECGKSNLLEAFYKLNPYEKEATYDLSEDWPADKWPPGDPKTIVCEAKFLLTAEEVVALAAAVAEGERDEDDETDEDGEGEAKTPLRKLPKKLEVSVSRSYGGTLFIGVEKPWHDKLGTAAGREWIAKNLPKCVYMDEFTVFNGNAELDQLHSKLTNHGRRALSREEETILIILELAQIDLDDLISKGRKGSTRTIRGFDTVRASAYLTRQFASLWKQKDIKFDIRVDGTTLDIFVEDVGLGMPIRLRRRSRGFQWYVSFIWRFSYASRGEFKNCILLLDEPGVHLHPAGHRDLLAFLQELSKSNAVVYTTHLATLLDTGYPERLKIMEVNEHHATIRNGMYSSQKQPMMVIEQALGLSGAMSGLLGTRQTLITEGGEDAVILQKLSGILQRSGEEGLSDRIYFWPAHGAQKTPMYAGFMVGQKLDAAVLLDSDPAGVEAKKKITEQFLKGLSEQNGATFRVLMLGEVADIKRNEAAIEDLFPVSFFLGCVGDAYRIRIDENELPNDGPDQICKRVEVVLKRRGVADTLDKKRILAELLKRFDKMETVADLPEGTYEKAKILVARINTAFGYAPMKHSRPKGKPRRRPETSLPT